MHLRPLLVLLVLLCLLGCVQPVRAQSPDFSEAILDVVLNGQPGGEMLVALRDAQGALWLDEADFARLRLRTPADAGVTRDGRRYLPLSSVSGARYRVDAATQRLELDAPGGAFLSTRVDATSRPAPRLADASPGAFLNYDVSAQRIGGATLGGGFAELGLFGPRGVLLASGLARHLPGDSRSVRLETRYIRDWPDRMERMTIGDAVSAGGTWGSTVRFMGLGWGRDFSLRPDLLTTPLLDAGGTAVVPSTVDVYVNDRLVSSQSVPPGPFVIGQLPAVTGAGQVSVVVRDALGREQVLTQAFYSSLRLLQAGLSQYQVDVGAVRRDFALASDHYGPLAGSATYRRGLSNALTAEVHGEFLGRDARAIGVAGAARLGRLAVLNVTAARGGDAQGSGNLLGLGLERQGSRFSVLVSSAIASADYRQVASAAGVASQFRRRDLAQFGANLRAAGSLSAALIREDHPGGLTARTLSLNYSHGLGGRGAVNLTATQTSQGGVMARSAFLTFTFAQGARRSTAITGSAGSGAGAPPGELYATLAENAPLGPGHGYRVGASSAGNYDAELRRQWRVGDLQLQAARNNDVSGASASWSGAATLLGGELDATRRVNGSFALVEVAGLQGLPVYVDNQLVTHTDAHGRALLHDLQPYEPNRINVDPTELPLDTTIGARTLELAPRYRSGVVVRFPVERVRGGLFRLLTGPGEVVPAGATVRFNGNTFPVGHNGVTYVTGYDHGAMGIAEWPGFRCAFRLASPPQDDPLPDVGDIACGVAAAAEPGR